VTELPTLCEQNPTEADGFIIVPLCETSAERETALQFIQQPILSQRYNRLLAIPRPLNSLWSLVQEVQRWDWISTNILELNADKFAREEVSRQRATARLHLEKRIQSYIGFKQLTGGNDARMVS